MSPWDSYPDVVSPVGRMIGEQLEVRPRRMPLDGFEPVYSDFVDYIIRCTHRIWEEKNIGLCRTHYAPDVVMHTLAGPACGAESVVQGTISSIAASSDRQVIGEDVIWSEDAPGLFLSSHRITSQMTHMGDDPMLGSATLRSTGATTIADCLCKDNRIIEEWLVRDNARAVAQVGRDPWEVACAQASVDREGDQSRHSWRVARMDAVIAANDAAVPIGHPAELPVAMLIGAFRNDLYGSAAEALSPTAEIRWPTNRHGFGRGYWIGCATQLRGSLHETAISIDHVAARPLPHGDTAVAVRWWLTGTHKGLGVWGPPTGRRILVLAVSHYVLRGSRIVEDVTVFDELAVLRQIAGGLGA